MVKKERKNLKPKKSKEKDIHADGALKTDWNIWNLLQLLLFDKRIDKKLLKQFISRFMITHYAYIWLYFNQLNLGFGIKTMCKNWFKHLKFASIFLIWEKNW